VIREGGISKRKLPRNLHPEDTILFEHALEQLIPPTRLLELHGVDVSPEGLLFKRGRVLPESFPFPVLLENFLRGRHHLTALVKNHLLRRRRRVAAPRLWITDDWSGGYFHWLVDALPRLLAVKDLAPNLVLLLPHALEGLEFVRSSLKLFRLGGVEYMPAGEVYVCDTLVMPTHIAPSGNYNEGLVRELRDLILDSYGIRRGARARGRLYISRGRAVKRKVANEEETRRILGAHGFQTVYFEEYAFAEQVRLAAGAEYLVSSHGAGLTNMLFMRSGQGVLELRRRGDRERNWYFILASAMDLAYYYQNCDPETPGDDSHSGNIVADPPGLEQNLTLMLDPGAL
jgi:capsular polysaccharide biosynthesis protein